MLGAIIGDIVGSRFEFNNTSDFELFTDECDYTDDTICTIAVADAILNGKPYREAMLEWCRRYPHPMGSYGGSVGSTRRDWCIGIELSADGYDGCIYAR